MFTFQTLYNFKCSDDFKAQDNQNNDSDERITILKYPEKIWVIPSHVFCCYEEGRRLVSYATYPDGAHRTHSTRAHDLSISLPSPVVELCTASLPDDNILIIVMQTGDVHIWKFDLDDLEWCKQFVFQLKSGNSETTLQAVVFHEQLEFAVWSEKHGSGPFEHSVFVRKYSSSTPRTISAFCLNDYISETVLTHCSPINLCNLGALVTLTLDLRSSPSVFFKWSTESGLSLLNTNGVVLWSCISSPYKRLAKIFTCTINLWEKSEQSFVIGHISNKVQGRLYILLRNGNLLSFNTACKLCAKISLPLNIVYEHFCGFFVFSNYVFIFTISEILMFDLTNGKPLGILSHLNIMPFEGCWYHTSSVSIFGIYTKDAIFRIVSKDYPTILSSLDKTVKSLGNADIDFVFKINSIVQRGYLSSSHMSRVLTPSLQSKALVLALMHHCNQLAYPGEENFNFKVIDHLLKSLPEAPNHKLKRSFRSMVECFVKLNDYCSEQSCLK